MTFQKTSVGTILSEHFTDIAGNGVKVFLVLSPDFDCPNIVTSRCKRDEKEKEFESDWIEHKPKEGLFINRRTGEEKPANELTAADFRPTSKSNNNGVAFTFMYPNYALTIFAYPDGTSYIKKA